MTIVLDQLGEHIPMSGRTSLLEGAYFSYWMRSPDGGAIWAKLPPEFWKELVKDGDMLTLSFPHGGQLATFLFSGVQQAIRSWVIVPIPKSYKVCISYCIFFNLGRSFSFLFFLLFGNGRKLTLQRFTRKQCKWLSVEAMS